jgi:signal peptidase I
MNAGVIGFVVTLLCVVSLSLVFTILYLNDYHNNKQEIEQGRRDIEFIDYQINLEKKDHQDKINVGKVVGKTTTIVLTFFTLVFFAFAIVNRINDNKIVIGDKTHIVVATGSMSKKHTANTYLDNYNLRNQFPANSIIEIRKVSQDKIYIYDIIAFKNDEGKTIIHRVRDIIYDGTTLRYVTRGDANAADDTYRPTYDNVIGRYTGDHVKFVGVFILFMQSNSGIVTVIAVFYCLGLFFYLKEKTEKQISRRTERIMAVIDYDLDDDEFIFDHDFVQNIYYKGFVYRFKNNKFLGKELIEDAKLKVDSDEQIIKITNDTDETEKIETFTIGPTKENP